MLTPTLIAIDAGGTKTDLLWAQPDGQVLSRAEGQGINIASKPPGVWDETLEDLLERAGVNRETVRVACAGAAGYTLPDRRAMFERLLQEKLPQARVLVLPDYAIALEGATGGAPGVLVIAGTGSIACGRDREGRLMRAGGWGYLLGDEGSGFWIGREAVRAALAAAEGWGEQTLLQEMLANTFGSADCGEWLSALYRTHNPQSLLAQCAPLVSGAAEQGDPLAERILTRGGSPGASGGADCHAPAPAGRLPRLHGGRSVEIAGGADGAVPSAGGGEPSAVEGRGEAASPHSGGGRVTGGDAADVGLACSKNT